MASFIDAIGRFFEDLLTRVSEVSGLQEPIWLLLAIIPAVLFASQLWRRREKHAELDYRNPRVHGASVIADNRQWPRRLVNALLLLAMLALVYPAARPINSSQTITEDALLIWVYDASDSMSTVDVLQEGQKVSRFEASVSALQESLMTIPPEYYKLLVSFSGVQEIVVNIPTLDNDVLLGQAENIVRGKFTASDYGLERAISACQQFFANQDNHPCEIFLLSDGQCNPRPQCYVRAEKLAAAASEKGIRVHAISWGDPESEYRAIPADMENLAAAGGGQHLSSAQTSELANLYQEVATGLKTQVIDQAIAATFIWGARLLIIVLAFVFYIRRIE